MPQSITLSVFGEDVNESQPEKKRKFSYLDAPKQPQKLTLLAKLGQVFNIFLYESKTKSDSSFGIFTSPDYIDRRTQKSLLPNRTATKNKHNKRSYDSLDHRSIGDVKRLVIATKPVKFHLIDTDKVFKPKRRRIISSWTASKQIADDDLSNSEDEAETKPNDRFPYRVNTNELSSEQKSGKTTFEGEAYVQEDTNITKEFNSDGYWCTPGIAELEKTNLEDLANVENFIIGRKGYGQIAYNHPVDLSGIAAAALSDGPSISQSLFGNIVQILEKHTIVYENTNEKPPIGFGLNVPATITLERMKPKDGVTISAYIQLLKRQVGMEFINYDPITYTWTFKVKHFSVWGLVEDNEDQLEDLRSFVTLKKIQDTKEDEASMEYSKIYEDQRYKKELRNQRLSNYTRGVPGGWKHNNFSTSSPLNIKRQLVADEIDSRLKDYEDDNRARKLSEQVSEITIELDRSTAASPFLPLEAVKSAVTKDTDVEYLKNLVSILPNDQNMEDIVQERAFEPQITDDAAFEVIQSKPNLPVAQDWLVQLELTNDYNSALLPYAALFEPEQGDLGQASAIEKLDHALFADFNRNVAQSMSTPIASPKTKKKAVPKDLKLLESIITKLVGLVKIQARDNGYPQSTTQESLTFTEISDDSTFALASALFDRDRFAVNLDSAEMEVVARQELLKQRAVFQEWITSYLASRSTRKNELQDPFEDIIERLVLGDIKGAVLLAQETSNPHLSVLLTLVDSNDDVVRGIAASQVSEWQKSGTSTLIPKNLVRIYNLLSGDVESITDGSWQETLAAQFFYGESESLESIIGNLITKFDAQVGSDDVFDILRLYMHISEHGRKGVVSWVKESGWSLMRAWLFSLVLSSGEHDEYDKLSSELGKLLELNLLWKQALFVFSHVHDDEICRHNIRRCVIEHINEDISVNDDIFQQLHIPEVLIHESSAIKAQKEGDYWQACRWFISAKLWGPAHDLIITQLGPETIISNDPVLKRMLLDLTSRFPDNGMIIPSWSHGAGIYTKYINLVEGGEDSASPINDLLTNIPHFRSTNNFNVLVALKIISKKVGDAAIAAKVSNYKDRVMTLYLGENETHYFKSRLSRV